MTAEKLFTFVRTTPQPAKIKHNKYITKIVTRGENPKAPIFKATWSLLLLKGTFLLINLKIISTIVSIIGKPRIITGLNKAKTFSVDA